MGAIFFTDLQALLPHRAPMLMLDRVLALEPGRRARAFLNVSHGGRLGIDPASGKPVLPRVFVIEAIGQAAYALVAGSARSEGAVPVPLFVGADAVRFYGDVVPGCRLDLEVEVEKLVSFAAIIRGRAWVGDRLVARMRLSAAVLRPGALEGKRWALRR